MNSIKVNLTEEENPHKKPEENHIAEVGEMIEESYIADTSKKVEEIITGCPTGWKCGAECTNRCIL